MLLQANYELKIHERLRHLNISVEYPHPTCNENIKKGTRNLIIVCFIFQAVTPLKETVPKREKHTLPIVDPDTGAELVVEKKVPSSCFFGCS